jgi:hypothetical protein
MTQERRRYGFVLERQCSLAKHYLAYHSQGSTVLQRHLEDWQEVAQTREFLPDAVEDMFNNRLRVSTVSDDGMSRWQLNVKNRHQLSPLSAVKFFSHILLPPKGRIQVRAKVTCHHRHHINCNSPAECLLLVTIWNITNICLQLWHMSKIFGSTWACSLKKMTKLPYVRSFCC